MRQPHCGLSRKQWQQPDLDGRSSRGIPIRAKNSDTHSRWVKPIHLRLAEKWRRVALGTALSQGGIRQNPCTQSALGPSTRPFSSQTQLDAETCSVQRVAGRNFGHRHHSPRRVAVLRRNGARVAGQVADESQGSRLWVERQEGPGPRFAKREPASFPPPEERGKREKGAKVGDARQRSSGYAPWHFLYFLPEPQGHGSLRPTLSSLRWTVGADTGSSPRFNVSFG